MKKIILKLGVLMILLPHTAMAIIGDTEDGTLMGELNTAKLFADAPDTEAPELLGNIIKVFINTLGLILVMLIVYAGYMYLTAAGDDEKVKKAKKLLGQAVIGLIIVLSAYAIALFVLGSLSEISKE